MELHQGLIWNYECILSRTVPQWQKADFHEHLVDRLYIPWHENSEWHERQHEEWLEEPEPVINVQYNGIQ